ncbi:MAG: tetratricopeptide repeat protein [Kiritimatiellales bacterium]
MMTTHQDRGRVIGISVLLIALTLQVFGRVIGFGFINCDDDRFVYNNPLVQKGLTADGVVSVLARSDQNFYYPLTVLSFMTDATLYGMNPTGFHLTNLLLHAGSVLLLFLALRRMTGSLWCSALAAALFAIHPLRAESVAWVTERKDVLSGLFFMLTLHAYIGYVRYGFSLLRYAGVLLCMIAGLLAKPMAVTLPLVLLLLDAWPLRRFETKKWQSIAAEKIPMLLISVLFGCLTLMSSTDGPASTLHSPALGWRLGNAVVSVAVYLRQLFVPSGLAMPVPDYALTGWRVAVDAGLLAGMTVAVLLLYRRKPFLLTGWFWFLIMLLPVSGVLRYLGTARADRFTYLSQVGLCVMLAWSLASLATSRRRIIVLTTGSLLFLTFLSAAAYRQAGFWKDSITLWNRTLSCTSNNSIAHNNLGVALSRAGDPTAAAEQFYVALQIDEHDTDAWFNIGILFAQAGRFAEAQSCFEQTLKINPGYTKAFKALGAVLILQGNSAEGSEWTRRYLSICPDDIEARQNLEAAGGEEMHE